MILRKVLVCVVHLWYVEDTEMDISQVPSGSEDTRRCFPANATSRQSQWRIIMTIIIFYILEKVSLCIPGLPWIHNPLASASQMMDYRMHYNTCCVLTTENNICLPNFFPDRFYQINDVSMIKFLPFYIFWKKMLKICLSLLRLWLKITCSIVFAGSVYSLHASLAGET